MIVLVPVLRRAPPVLQHGLFRGEELGSTESGQHLFLLYKTPSGMIKGREHKTVRAGGKAIRARLVGHHSARSRQAVQVGGSRSFDRAYAYQLLLREADVHDSGRQAA